MRAVSSRGPHGRRAGVCLLLAIACGRSELSTFSATGESLAGTGGTGRGSSGGKGGKGNAGRGGKGNGNAGGGRAGTPGTGGAAGGVARAGSAGFASAGSAAAGGSAGSPGLAGGSGGTAGAEAEAGAAGEAGAAAEAACGNGVVEDGEECDDANFDLDDACLEDCRSNVCGDGYVWANVEGCEDGNALAGDGCFECRREPVSLAAAGNTTCVLFAGAEVKCWGGNAQGQLGLGDVEARGDSPSELDSLGVVPLPAEAYDVSVGNAHVCSRLADGSLRCWGANGFGELGIGDSSDRGDQPGELGAALERVDFGSGEGARKVALGGGFGCALLVEGGLKCWGQNGSGQLGAGDHSTRGDQPGELGAGLPAVNLGEVAPLAEVAAGRAHACALLADGKVKCWGANAEGQLGAGDLEERGGLPEEMGDGLPYVDLGSGTSARHLVLGYDHTCALLSDARVKCWGKNLAGQLGLGDTERRGDTPASVGDALPPLDLGAAGPVSALAAGSLHTCALFESGRVKCWGYNYFGQLGLGDREARGVGPGEMGDALPYVELGSGRTARAIAAGAAHTCALLDDGTVKCWGRATPDGQLGLGDTASRGDDPGEMGDELPPLPLAY